MVWVVLYYIKVCTKLHTAAAAVNLIQRHQMKQLIAYIHDSQLMGHWTAAHEPSAENTCDYYMWVVLTAV